MTIYENEFSNFPEKKITRHNYKNVDDTLATVINQVNELREQGLYNQAARIIEANKDILSQYVVDAVTYRTWEEEIWNTQKFAKQRQQVIYYEEDEDEVLENCIEGDVWVGGE